MLSDKTPIDFRNDEIKSLKKYIDFIMSVVKKTDDNDFLLLDLYMYLSKRMQFLEKLNKGE